MQLTHSMQIGVARSATAVVQAQHLRVFRRLAFVEEQPWQCCSQNLHFGVNYDPQSVLRMQVVRQNISSCKLLRSIS